MPPHPTEEGLMMSSTMAPHHQGSGVPTPLPPHLQHHLSPSSSSTSSPSQLPYEGRISLNPLGYPGSVHQYPQGPYTANLNFNLINNAFPVKRGMGPPSPSPSSASGSPRTDDMRERSSELAEASSELAEASSEGTEGISGLEIMRQQIQQIPHPVLSLRQDMGEERESFQDEELKEQQEHYKAVEVHDIEDEEEHNDEELRIDEEMADEPNDSLMEAGPDVTFEEKDGGESKPFVGFQPYLQPRSQEDLGGANSLEKLQQVLNSRMFSRETEGKMEGGKEIEGVSHGAVRSDAEFGFLLPSDEDGQAFQCHLCAFTATARVHFNNHVNTHYEFQCVKCDFETKTEYDYCKHLKAEHGLVPEDLEEAEVRVPRVNSQGKVKTFKCKQCEFVAVTKIDFWKHGRGHIKPEKLLFCPKCIFVTEYKHHLEYHLRNHYGTKPFKCTHCNYSCVNKSMLNSHMKSHTNVYQYRCADCTYATKYCHSLKLHLKKYAHKPAMVLNNDGSPNPSMGLSMDPFKKGSKKSKLEEGGLFPASLLPQFQPFPPSFPPGFPPGLMQMIQLQQNAAQKAVSQQPFIHRQQQHEEERGVSPPSMLPQEILRCDKCDFTTSSVEVHKNHIGLHATTERSALHHLLTSPLQNKHHQDFNRSSEEVGSPGTPLRSGPTPSFPFRSLPFPNPFLQNMMPNPTIQALMEERKRQEKEVSIPSSPESFQQSPGPKEEAPLPPNKRLKTDIFASLYASRMSEMEKDNSADSPPLSQGVLDLSKEQEPIGGGSHGSSSDNDSGSNPRSHSSSPSLSSSGTKNRRKGKAFKITRQEDTASEEEEIVGNMMPSLLPITRPTHAASEGLACVFCGISFQNSLMHSVHMGYHGHHDPFKCNSCGEETRDALSFFLHIARKEHR